MSPVWGDQTPSVSVNNVIKFNNSKSPLHYCAWENGPKTHPDQDFVKTLLDGIKYGVNVGYTGPRIYRENPNWPSAIKNRDAIEKAIQKDLKLGRKIGPFTVPPCENFIGSPMGAFEKRRSPGKYRVIHDLSWPEGSSINDFISKSDHSMQYISIDNIVQKVVAKCHKCLMAKLDIEDAFKHIIVRPEDVELLGTTWTRQQADGGQIKEYYLDLVLPFGMRSSPKLFNDYADGLEFIMKANGSSEVLHYLDDYFTCGQAGTKECRENLDIMLDTCRELGFSVQPTKVEPPTSSLEILDIVVDTDLKQLRISQDRLAEIMNELQHWSNRKYCKKREFLSLIGKLSFVSSVVKSGRTFTRRLIDLSKAAKYLHHKLKLNLESRMDIQWWIDYLPNWNGISFFHDSEWITNEALDLFTDASDHGIGCYFMGSWIYQKFPEGVKEKVSITWRELYAIVVAVLTWSGHFQGKRIIFHCDNLAVVHIVTKGTSRDMLIMNLVRTLFFACAQNSFEFKIIHVAGIRNEKADALSRGDLDRFWLLTPNADRNMTVPPPFMFQELT